MWEWQAYSRLPQGKPHDSPAETSTASGSKGFEQVERTVVAVTRFDHSGSFVVPARARYDVILLFWFCLR